MSEDDVKALVDRAATSGAIEPAEHRLVQRALAIGDRKAKALMVPRSEVVWIEETMSTEGVRVLLGTSPYSHFPICRGTFDELVGVVHIKDRIACGLLGGHDFPVATVGGLVVRQLGRIPETGTTIEWEGLRLEVVDMDGHRIDQLLVSRTVGSSH